jgi:imidazolonepropionase-like amidohydrolase
VSGRLFPLFQLFVLSCGGSAPTRAPSPPRIDADVAFAHVAVVPMDAPRVLPDQTVLVKGSRIVAVGPAAAVAVPPGARTIDGAGKFLMPGLADMHVHLNDSASLALSIANGVTTVRNMWGSRRTLDWRARIERGERLGPTIHTAGPILDGVPPYNSGSTAVKDAAEAAAAVRAQKASGYDFVKVYSALTTDAYDAIADEAGKVGLPFAGHVPDRVGVEHALEKRQRSIEHFEGYFLSAQRDDSPIKGKLDMPSIRRAVDYLDEAKLAALVQKTRAAGTWNCPTMVSRSKYLSPAEAKVELARPEMRSLPPTVRATWDPANDPRYRARTDEDYAVRKRDYARRMKLLKELHDAGARLLSGTDFPNPFVVPGFALHEELALFVAAGLTPYEAIRAGTADAAEYLGDAFGVIAPGKRADLILVEANPLDDVKNVARRAGVMVRGVWRSESELHAILGEIEHEWDPSRDRLAKAPPLPGAHAYRHLANGVLVGQQRYAISRDGARAVLIAQEARDGTEPGSSRTEFREDIGAGGQATAVDLRRDGDDGMVTVRARIEKGRVIGEARAGDAPPVAIDEPGDGVFVPGTVGAWHVLLEREAGLRVGATVVVHAKDVDAEPTVHLVDVIERITRLPDVSGRRRFAVEEERKNGSEKSEVTLAEDGFIGEMTIHLQHGEATVVRAP